MPRPKQTYACYLCGSLVKGVKHTKSVLVSGERMFICLSGKCSDEHKLKTGKLVGNPWLDRCARMASTINGKSARDKRLLDPWFRLCQQRSKQIVYRASREKNTKRRQSRRDCSTWQKCLTQNMDRLRKSRRNSELSEWDKKIKSVFLCHRLFRNHGGGLVAKIKRQDLADLLEEQGYRCALSGVKLHPESASVDHVIPISRGGMHDIGNLQWVTPDINRAKGTLTNEEFVELCRVVVEHEAKRTANV